MKTEFTLPDFTYFPMLRIQRGPEGRWRDCMVENYIEDCTKACALEWVQTYESELTAIYCYEGGKLFDASSEIAKAWLDKEGVEYCLNVSGDSYKFPAFIRNHAGKELDELIAIWESEVKEGEALQSEAQFQFDNSR